MRGRVLVAVLIAGLAAVWVSREEAAAQAPAAGAPNFTTWDGYLGGPDSSQYTSLTQINKDNVVKLGPVWLNHVSAAPVTTPVPGPGTNDTGQQTTPIAIDGVIYMDTPNGDVIEAAVLDAQTSMGMVRVSD